MNLKSYLHFSTKKKLIYINYYMIDTSIIQIT